MNAYYKGTVIEVLGNVNPDRYTDFINTVNQLSRGMNLDNKKAVIEVLGEITPKLYPFLQNFIRKNPNYFRYVPLYNLLDEITPNMTEQELRDLLQRFHRYYYR